MNVAFTADYAVKATFTAWDRSPTWLAWALNAESGYGNVGLGCANPTTRVWVSAARVQDSATGTRNSAD
ncbi:hypothetical protein GCM10027199_83920 [Amycolatopsis magusensis]